VTAEGDVACDSPFFATDDVEWRDPLAANRVAESATRLEHLSSTVSRRILVKPGDTASRPPSSSGTSIVPGSSSFKRPLC
jgi:hypothetical protein